MKYMILSVVLVSLFVGCCTVPNTERQQLVLSFELHENTMGAEAYCNSDGTIVISQWMRNLCANENELAAIVAHEKTHLVLGNGEKSWCKKVSGWFTDESKLCFRGLPDPKSVEREKEADEKGLMLMAEAGYDPQAAMRNGSAFSTMLRMTETRRLEAARYPTARRHLWRRR